MALISYGCISLKDTSKMKEKTFWKTVQVPEGLLDKVDELVGMPELGYSSRSEFIKEAIRLRIFEVEELLRKRKSKN